MKVSFKVHKKGMGSINKKVRLADSNFGPVVLNILILKKCQLKRGKLWKSMKNVDFHMILPSKKSDNHEHM
jgi:hypothetical protein